MNCTICDKNCRKKCSLDDLPYCSIHNPDTAARQKVRSLEHYHNSVSVVKPECTDCKKVCRKVDEVTKEPMCFYCAKRNNKKLVFLRSDYTCKSDIPLDQE